MSNHPPAFPTKFAEFFPGPALDAYARQLTPSGLRGLPRALAVRFQLAAVPDGLGDVAARIERAGLHVRVDLPDNFGDLLRAIAAHGFTFRAGPFSATMFAGDVADPGAR